MKKNIITYTIFFLLMSQSILFASGKVFVLGYHSFLGGARSRYDFSRNEMKRHIAYFKSRGFQFVSFQDIVDGTISGNKNILITIDDGNRSVYRLYRDVLEPAGIRPLLAIYTAPVGRERFALNWRQLEELSRAGCEIASHGYYHLKMTRRLYRKKRRRFLQEIYRPKAELEKRLGKEIRVFVFPYGLFQRSSFHHLNEAGYRYAFTTYDGTVYSELGRNKKRYELARYMMDRGSWKYTFAKIVRKSGANVTIAKREQRKQVPKVKKKEKKISIRTRIAKLFSKEKKKDFSEKKIFIAERKEQIPMKYREIPDDKSYEPVTPNPVVKKRKQNRQYDATIGWSSFVSPKKKRENSLEKKEETQVEKKRRKKIAEGRYSAQRIKRDYITRKIRQRLKYLENVKNVKNKGGAAMRRSLQNYNELLDTVWKRTRKKLIRNKARENK